MHSKRTPTTQSQPIEQKNPNAARYEPSVQVNWLTKTGTISNKKQEYLVRNSANDRDIPRQVTWDKESFFTLFPNKKIDLTRKSHHHQQNQDRSRNNSHSSSGLQSHKVSCEKKQKLTVLSKRLSVRKINDFMDVSLSPYSEDPNRQSQRDLKSAKPIDSCQIQSRDNNGCKGKKRIRISLRNDHMPIK